MLKSWTQLKTTNSQGVYRSKSTFTLGPVGHSESSESKQLVKVVYEDDNCFIVGEDPSEHAIHSWKVLNSYSSMHAATKESLLVGDIFKLGRVRFQVMKVSWKDPIKPVEVPMTEYTEEPDDQCRVCMVQERSNEDPLLCVCNCRGTLKFIHLNCLQHIINSRSYTDNFRNCTTFNWHDLNCRVCRGRFVIDVRTPWLSKSLLCIPESGENHVVLQQLHRNGSKMITYHLLYLRKTLIFGSSPESDLALSDQRTVCPSHASLKKEGGDLFLEGSNTRFVTAVLVNRPILLENRLPILLEAGMNILHFSIEPRTNGACCFSFWRRKSYDFT